MEVVPALQRAKKRFTSLVDDHKLRGETVRVDIGTLTPEQAIGKPSRQDFALLGGKEVMIEAQFKESFGQAFTNQPQNFNGLLDDVLNFNLDTINRRAIFIATMNAVCSHLGLIGKVRHCRNQEPEDCGREMTGKLINQYGKIKIGMVGYQPAILENLVKMFGVHNVRCSDLDSKNIGANKFGVTICDGSAENKNLIKWCDLLLATGSTHVNNTFDDLYKETISLNKNFIMFGVTGAGIAALLGLEIICPLSTLKIGINTQGGAKMVYGFGRGLGGRGGAGLGFRGSSPPWPYVGRGRGGLPRCQYPGVASFPRYAPASPYATQMTHEQELDLLKGQAEAIKKELNQMEGRIRDLETRK